jgi:filamentous hemagglutinin
MSNNPGMSQTDAYTLAVTDLSNYGLAGKPGGPLPTAGPITTPIASPLGPSNTTSPAGQERPVVTTGGSPIASPLPGGNSTATPIANPQGVGIVMSQATNQPVTTQGQQIIDQTLNNRGNFTHPSVVDGNEALAAGLKFLGAGYREVGNAGSGVFHSADGTREFRIDSGSTTGSHNPGVPHVHFGLRDPTTGRYISNNHVPFRN